MPRSGTERGALVEQVTIASRFNGPPDSANGGDVIGLLARWIDGPAQVTLRVPPPLGRELRVESDGRRAVLLDADVLVAEAERAAVEVEVPDVVTFADAAAAAARYPWREKHPYPTC